jgi:hypothetical protein
LSVWTSLSLFFSSMAYPFSHQLNLYSLSSRARMRPKPAVGDGR